MWDRRHLLGLKDLGREDIELILDNARSFREVSSRDVKKVPALRGKTVVNLFFENSTRTRMSFELAAKRLSADVINFAASTSSLTKGETMLDTLKTIEAYSTDIFVIRHSHSTAPLYLSQHTQSSIINAGDGQNEHPTQALLDMFTVREKLGTLEGLKVVIMGDITHSRVARSNIWGFSKFGSEVTVCGPVTMVPKFFDEMPCSVSYNTEEALKDADVVIMLRIQRERLQDVFFPSQEEYNRYFALTKESARFLKKSALVLHPGPVNWDAEIDSSLKERVFPLILEQVTNGLAVRMSVLYLLGGNKGE